MVHGARNHGRTDKTRVMAISKSCRHRARELEERLQIYSSNRHPVRIPVQVRISLGGTMKRASMLCQNRKRLKYLTQIRPIRIEIRFLNTGNSSMINTSIPVVIGASKTSIKCMVVSLLRAFSWPIKIGVKGLTTSEKSSKSSKAMANLELN